MARILFQWQEKYCLNGKTKTVFVATVEFPQLTVSLFPRLAALHRRSFPTLEVASAICTFANYCILQYCTHINISRLYIITLEQMQLHQHISIAMKSIAQLLLKVQTTETAVLSTLLRFYCRSLKLTTGVEQNFFQFSTGHQLVATSWQKIFL